MTDNTDPTRTVVPSAMAGRLQNAANIAVLLAGMSVVWIAWQRTQSPTPAPPPTYAVGDQIDAVDGVDFRASRHTLVLALREGCRFCQESVPFYQKLTAVAGESTERAFQLTVVSTDPMPALSAYLKANGIKADRAISIRPGTLKIPGTPHLLLVDSNGTVQRVWRGRLARAQEEEVFAQLGLTAIN